MVSDDPPSDSFEFWVRFVCGSIFGTLLAFLLWWSVLASPLLGWFWILPGPIIFGFVAAYWGDRFWHFLLGLFRWW
ncbi:MAG TPA: hypothetical protein VN957_21245 [Chthoniobacterales bacterium]|nr:hypothetical protein [Chthoniobacterales bacterium]